MKILVKVKPQAKQDKVKKISSNSYSVSVKAKAVGDKANQAVVKVLTEYFDLAKSKIVLIKGKRTRDKVFTVKV